MAAYAAVASLMNTLNDIQNHPRISTFLDHKQVESLHKSIDFLLHFIESTNSHEEEVLETRIASAAHAAEDAIESHIADQIRAEFTSSSCLLDLEGVIKDMNSVKETVAQFEESKECRTALQLSYSTSSKPLAATKNVMVGFDDDELNCNTPNF